MAELGTRAKQRAQTRERLQQSALELFHRDGFDATSVAEIAAAAGVTERTFFRHFPSKEAVLFQDYESRLEWFSAALAVRPLDEPILASVAVAVNSFPDDREILHQVAALRDSVLRPEAIEAHLRLVQGAFAHELEGAIRQKMEHARATEGTDTTDERIEFVSVVVANVIAGALLGVLDVWTRRGGGDPEDMAVLLGEAGALLGDLPLR